MQHGSDSCLAEYKEIAERYSACVILYLLKPTMDSSYQNLLVVRRFGITDERMPNPEIDISVSKTWNDNSNAYNNRPTSITVKLYQNGSYTGKSLTLNSSNGWKGTFSQVDAGTGYSVQESSVPTGYTVSYGGSQSNGFTITNTLNTTSVTVTKNWSDDNNRDGLRSSVTVTLYETVNGTKSVSKDASGNARTLTFGTANSSTQTFSNLPTHRNGSAITYSVEETSKPSGYTATVTKNSTNNFTITNSHTPEVRSIAVTKVWDDDYNGINDFDELRPSSIKVTLYANGTKVTKDASGNTITNPITISGTSSENEWKASFTNLYKYESGKEIQYTIEESEIPDGYTSKKTGNMANGFKITNTHEPNYEGYKEIRGTVWVDGAPGKGEAINGELDNKDTLLEGITVRLKYIDSNGKSQIFDPDHPEDYETTTDANGEYSIKINYDTETNVYKLNEDPTTTTYKTTLANKLSTAYVEFEYDGMLYTTLAYDNTADNKSKAKEDEDRRNEIDNDYDSVDSNTPALEREENENGISTNLYSDNDKTGYWDEENRKITASTQNIVSLKESEFKTRETSAETIKKCNGSTYERTNQYGAWNDIVKGKCTGTNHTLTYNVDVDVIANVNLGLFEREQPDVALDTDIKKVEVEMKGQRYTYVYGVQGNESSDIQTKFQKKESYTYRMPVNPADISYLKNVDSTAMNVYVTYEISIGNASNTLTITVDNIVNYYDSNYEIESITLGTFKKATGAVTGTSLSIPTSSEKTGTDGKKYKQITLTGLGITVTSTQDESENKIYIKYKVSQSQLVSLFNNEAPLNNASEILKYSTTYGTTTLYAEERKDETEQNGRGNQAYAGYDFNSHPGNAGINLVKETDSEGNTVYRLRSTDNLVKYTEGGSVKTKPEDDTDIAPAFVLCKDETPQTLSGTVWEDSKTDQVDIDGDGQTNDENIDAEERLGNGYIDEDGSEKNVENVKIELYEINTDSSGNVSVELAKLYNKNNDTWSNAVTYSNSNGEYKFEGVVTGEYFVRYTYGNDTSELKLSEAGLTDDDVTKIQDETVVNARNYKSTIITDTTIEDVMSKDYGASDYNEKWHITHKDGYSVAVDNMLDRLEIEDLVNGNFNKGETITAYTKPFKSQVEFDASGIGNIDSTQKDQKGDETVVTGKLENEVYELSKLDFGIIERPQEELIVQKTITNFSISLSNGQVLAAGNPTQDTNINYTKSIGFRQAITNAKQAQETDMKRLLVEIDSELIQGAQLEVTYSVKVKNNNEIDYDYGEISNYSGIKSDITTGVGDGYITRESYANYYYYGEKSGLNEIEATIEFVDYLNKDLTYNSSDATKTDSRWYTVSNFSSWYEGEDDEGNLISKEVKNANVENNYNVLQCNWDNDSSTQHDTVTIARTEWTEELKMTASKVLANQDDNTYDNNAEIIRIDGKTARTVKAILENDDGTPVLEDDGTPKRVTYTPGDYIPGVSSPEEIDDDRVDLVITPPTGITNYITTYLIAALVGLIIAFVGVIFIKKKVLIK